MTNEPGSFRHFKFYSLTNRYIPKPINRFYTLIEQHNISRLVADDAKKVGDIDKVKMQNAVTRSIKLEILKTCGLKGLDWYERLQDRTDKRKSNLLPRYK